MSGGDTCRRLCDELLDEGATEREAGSGMHWQRETPGPVPLSVAAAVVGAESRRPCTASDIGSSDPASAAWMPATSRCTCIGVACPD